MGGNAIKIAKRVPRERFFEYAKDIIPMVEEAFNTEVSMVNGFHNKQDFGDLDLLLLDIGYKNRRKILEDHFNPEEININTNVVSFNYNELQVDLIFTPIENWETSKIFYEWGDLGNFIGKITNNYGRLRSHGFSMKYGYDGFKCKLLHNGNHKNIYLTKNNKDVFDFLGLDFDRWKLGFDEKEDMFDYIIESKYFDYPSFQWENLNSINKDRNKRRPNYVKFLEYIEDHKNIINWDKGYEFYLNEIKDFFGTDLLEELEKFKNEMEQEEIIKGRFNGNLIMGMYPELKGEKLGRVMNDFKSSFENWDKFVYDNSSETIMKEFTEFFMEERLGVMISDILFNLSNGFFGCTVKVPNLDKELDCEIKSIDFTNLFHLPIFVKVLTKGFEEEHTVYEDVECFGQGYDYDNTTVAVKKKRPLVEMRIDLEWIISQHPKKLTN